MCLNAISQFVSRVFPDGEETWTVAQIQTIIQHAYTDPEDDLELREIKRDRIYDAIERIRAHAAEFPKHVSELDRAFIGNCYRYAPHSARRILKELMGNRLPKKISRQTQCRPNPNPNLAPEAKEPVSQ